MEIYRNNVLRVDLLKIANVNKIVLSKSLNIYVYT